MKETEHSGTKLMEKPLLKVSMLREPKRPLATPQSENRRSKTPLHPSASGSKQRLEEKFNANQAQQVQLQATLKEKAETELKRLRQTLCFKARPLPDFYRERATPKNQVEKVQLTHPQSPNLGRTPTPSMLKSTSQPPQRSSFKNSSSKHAMGKKSDNSRSLTSRLRSIASENTSPNIQHEQVAKK
ncbi:hypothetical protein GH714_041846 [Hevea brasiliensis]|uniref:TPX2 C-terminal domain-containing protein n=1 Tax=Hevea brasiliensis TaxID=3981 RepID=A0A6A6MV95_HEVBR|nr:hypothetical protein GH714_041846 [Hevea brasiliensis]